MATVDIFTDPPAEQLYDELLSRLWALHQLADFPVADISRPETTRRLEAVAATAVDTLRTEGDPTPITTVLWPNRAPPAHSDAWWRTPLGELLTHYWGRGAAHPSTSPHP
jgi:hypothetical protein